MEKIKPQLVLRKDDYELLIGYLRGDSTTEYDRQDLEELQSELKKAKLVEREEFPLDVVRLNSVVKIRESNKSKEMVITLVTPDKADIKSRKISIMAPIGTALIGFKKGQKVKWQVPSGEKTYLILDVQNHFD